MMSAIRPNYEQFQQLAQSPEKGTVVMLNLLKFKERASGSTDDSGGEAYRLYGDAAVRMIEEREAASSGRAAETRF
jgi:hypothetical protein